MVEYFKKSSRINQDFFMHTTSWRRVMKMEDKAQICCKVQRF